MGTRDMDEDIKWLIGLATAMLGVWLTTFMGAVWQLLRKIGRVEDDRKAADDALHERVNKVREDTVHKTDLNEMGARLSGEIQRMETQQVTMNSATNQRLDKLLEAIANRNEDRGKGGDR